MKRTLTVLGAVMILSALLGSCAPSPSDAPTAPTSDLVPGAAPTVVEQLIPLKVGFANYASNAPIYFALKEGFFRDEGLDVELVTFASSNEIYPALIAGQVDAVGWTLAPANL